MSHSAPPSPDSIVHLEKKMIEALDSCKRVLVTTHVRPDGDAVGTLAAMVLAIRGKGIGVEALLLSKLPTKYGFVLEENGIGHLCAEPSWPVDLEVGAFDAVLVVDTGTWTQLPGLKERAGTGGAAGKALLVLDHHQTQEEWATVKLVDTAAPAAAEVAAGLIRTWGIKFDRKMAEAIFLGLVSDTGWFQYSSTRPATLRLAAELMEAGVDTDRLQQRLYQSESAERIRLQTIVEGSLKLLAGNRLAVMRCRAEDFARAGAKLSDTENVINVPMQIATVQVSVLLTEPPAGEGSKAEPIRVSVRSKGQVDVSKFAEQFGGGGHARAAGLKVAGTLDEAEGKVVAAMVEMLEGGMMARKGAKSKD
jgi:bifunctional oligoribonuclease and PAP phosphatase NrnA